MATAVVGDAPSGFDCDELEVLLEPELVVLLISSAKVTEATTADAVILLSRALDELARIIE